jgi:hypothetical protein
MSLNYNRKSDDIILCEGLKLLHGMKIRDHNRWRMKNPTIRPDISGQDLSRKNLSGVYLNGVSCVGTIYRTAI